MAYVLGIETSCDDTAVAVVDDRMRVCANIVSSQFEEHAPYFGVVPEIASRTHVKNIPHVFRAAVERAGIGLDALSAVAVTHGPGLMGSLLVGLNFAKGLAVGRGIPFFGVNHIQGHVAALFLEHGAIELPGLALIVSGGHTHLFWVEGGRSLSLLVKTRDDSAGEAFDKLSKMLGLGFPGGALVDRLSKGADPRRYDFSQPKISDGSLDYSFSGFKTAALRHIERCPEDFVVPDGAPVRDLCASFQRAIVAHLMDRVVIALRKCPARSLMLGGGVACNRELRSGMTELGLKHRLPTYLTSPILSTDNAAMIAMIGVDRWRRNTPDSLALDAHITAPAYRDYRPLHGIPNLNEGA